MTGVNPYMSPEDRARTVHGNVHVWRVGGSVERVIIYLCVTAVVLSYKTVIPPLLLYYFVKR